MPPRYGNLQLDKLLASLGNGELPSESEIMELCLTLGDILKAEPNYITIHAPVSIVGDIHGQFPDLLQLFAISGEIPDCNYLFLGDYVDRGMHSVETMTILIALKLRYPNRLTLIRGNHESRAITQVYGFYDECLQKYGTALIWRAFTSFFDTLPLAALIEDKVLCIHGGLSPSIPAIDDILSINRGGDVPATGPMCDLLWSDPTNLELQNGWDGNPRGAGYLFGCDVALAFNRSNNIEYVCRAHQLVQEGYKWHFGNAVLTVWSAPNYCYRCGNLAAVLELDEHMNRKFRTFYAATEQLFNYDRRHVVNDYFL